MRWDGVPLDTASPTLVFSRVTGVLTHWDQNRVQELCHHRLVLCDSGYTLMLSDSMRLLLSPSVKTHMMGSKVGVLFPQVLPLAEVVLTHTQG